MCFCVSKAIYYTHTRTQHIIFSLHIYYLRCALRLYILYSHSYTMLKCKFCSLQLFPANKFGIQRKITVLRCCCWLDTQIYNTVSIHTLQWNRRSLFNMRRTFGRERIGEYYSLADANQHLIKRNFWLHLTEWNKGMRKPFGLMVFMNEIHTQCLMIIWKRLFCYSILDWIFKHL